MASFSYATVEDYEARTGFDVPADMEDTYQLRLDDASNLVALYLGECEPQVAAEFPEILCALVCSLVYRLASVPAGVRSKSIGATSVSYMDEAGNMNLLAAEEDLLDGLMARACPNDSPTDVPGLGCVGVTWGGYSNPAEHWARYVDVWVS